MQLGKNHSVEAHLVGAAILETPKEPRPHLPLVINLQDAPWLELAWHETSNALHQIHAKRS